ncbi:MAG: arsenite methyltransferase [Planctomycetota bacterium]
MRREETSENDLRDLVREAYGALARQAPPGDPGARALAEAFGYSPDELASVPEGAELGLSCGNPVAFASLRPGETVVDLGCGPGRDVFLASERVGSSGRAIGIDVTPEMVELARKNAERGRNGVPYANVEFHLAEMERLPLPDASADCVISNCAINLAPDKRAVFREISRILKLGGRLAVSDIALKKELPREIATDPAAYVACIAGAISIDEYRRGLFDAGFAAVEIVEERADLGVLAQPACGCSCGSSCGSAAWDPNEYAASVRVYGAKPR